MFALWYVVFGFWILVTTSTSLIPSTVNLQDNAELAQRSVESLGLPQKEIIESQSSLLDRLDKLTEDWLPESVIASQEPPSTDPSLSSSPTMALIQPSFPSLSAVFPVFSYSTILAIIGFISMRIAQWRQRRRARQQGIRLGGIELLPTSTATISPRLRDTPLPPPLAPAHRARSASVTSLPSFSPHPSIPWSYSGLGHEVERPISPVQLSGFSPGAKIKRRCNSFDLGATHNVAPMPLQHANFEHRRIPPSRDDEDDLPLIHFTSSHWRASSRHGRSGLWYSTPSTPFAPSHPEPSLIDFSSSLPLDRPRSTQLEHTISMPAHHTTAWAFDINLPSAPRPSLPAAHRRERSSSSEVNLIVLSPSTKSKILPEPSQVTSHGHDDLALDNEAGYPGGVEDEMDIVGWEWEFKAGHALPDVVHRQPTATLEDDLAEDVRNMEEGLVVGQLFGVAPSLSSTSTASEPVLVEKDEVKEVDEKAASLESLLDSESSSPVIINDNILEPLSQQEADADTTLVEEDIAVGTMNDEKGEIEEQETHELINDFNENNENNGLDHLAPFTTAVDKDDALFDALSMEVASRPEVVTTLAPTVKVSLPPSPVPSNCGSLPDPDAAGDPAMLEVEQTSVQIPVDQVDQGFDYPDPDFLPLPELPLPNLAKFPVVDVANNELLSLPTSSPSPSPPVSPHQIPTPPASPPSSPRLSGLANITNRPAWSVRASDMPPLGIHASVVNTLGTKKSMEVVGKRHDENWDVVKRRKMGKAKERKEGEEAGLEVEVEAESEVINPEEKEGIDTPTSPDVVVIPAPSVVVETPSTALVPSSDALFSPTASLASLPGAFPTDLSQQSTSETSLVKAESPNSKNAASFAVDSVPPRRHTNARSPIDIALAMQLRPGLGLGADPAWMVRFLMAMFGWFVVLISGSSGDTYGYGAGMAGAFVGVRRRE